MNLLVVSILSLLALVSADAFIKEIDDWNEIYQAPTPKPCCTPKQWEGNLGETTAYYSYRHHHPGVVMMGARISYDGTNKKVAVTAYVAKRPPMKIIMDYSQNKLYLINNSTQRCKVVKTKKQFKPACIPSSAKFIGSFYQGAGGAKLNENAWAVRVKNFGVIASVTKTGCIPIGEVVVGQARGTLVSSSVGYSNITPGIKNPKVFTPPSYCKSLDDEEDLYFGEEYPILEYMKYKFQEE